MWVFFSIRMESRTRTSYLVGHNRWAAGPPGATIVNLAAWPSSENGVYYYNAFVANIADREQFRAIVQGGGGRSRRNEDGATREGGDAAVSGTGEESFEDAASVATVEGGDESHGEASRPATEGSPDGSRGVEARKVE